MSNFASESNPLSITSLTYKNNNQLESNKITDVHINANL